MNDGQSDEGDPSRNRSPLGLALTGGGFRAAFFHVGVLAQLARFGLLRQVEILSTVSGGSIVGALYYLHLKNLLESRADAEITDDDYVTIIAAVERQLVAGVSSNVGARSLLHIRQNLRMVGPRYSRSDRLGEIYDAIFLRPTWEAPLFGAPAGPRRYQGPIQMRELIVHPAGEPPDFHPLRDNARRLAAVPVLLVNATTLNTGHVWRFEASRMGEPPQAEDAPDSRSFVGADSPNELVEDLDRNMRLRPPRAYDELPKQHRETPLGAAVAASSAVPGLVPPLALLGLYPDIDVQLVDGSLAEAHGLHGLCDYGCKRFVLSSGSRGVFDLHRPSTASADVRMRASTINLERLRSAELSRIRQVNGRVPVTLIHLRKGLPTTALPWIGREGVADVAARERTTPADCETFGVAPSVQEALSRVRNAFGSFTEVEAMSLMLDGYRIGEHELRPISDVSQPREASWDFEQLGPLMSDPTPEYLRQLRLAAHRTGRLALRPVLQWFVLALLGAVTVAAAVSLGLFVPPWVVALAVLSLVLAFVLATRPARTPGARVAISPLRGLLQTAGAAGAPAGAALLLLFDRMTLPAGRAELLQEKRGAGGLPRLGRPPAPPRPKIVAPVLTVIGFVAGSVPLALVLERPWLLGGLAVEAVVVGALTLRGFSPKAPSAPMTTELALAAAAALFPAAVLALLSLGFYEAVRGVAYLVGVVVRLLGGDLRPDTEAVALYPAIGFGLLFGLAFAAQTAAGTANKLYPEGHGGRSLFYAAAATRGRMVAWGFAIGVLVVAALIAVSIVVDRKFAWGLEVFVLAATSRLWQRGRVGAEHPNERVVAEVGEMLRSAGFEVRREAATGRPSVDSVVRGVDLVADGHERSLAIEVKTGSRSTPRVDWTAASSLRVAASALGSEIRSRGGAATPVEPVLILVGVDADETLEEFSRDVEVTLVRLPDAGSLDLSGEGSDGSGRTDLARALGLPVTPNGGETNAN